VPELDTISGPPAKIRLADVGIVFRPRDREPVVAVRDFTFDVPEGSIVTIVYEGDSPDLAERYLIGHMEEKTGDLDVVSPNSPLGSALVGSRKGDTVEYQAPNGTLRVKVVEVEAS